MILVYCECLQLLLRMIVVGCWEGLHLFLFLFVCQKWMLLLFVVVSFSVVICFGAFELVVGLSLFCFCGFVDSFVLLTS